MPLHTSNIIYQKTDTQPSGTAQTEGSVYYDDSEAQLKHYDGTAWVRVNPDIVATGGDQLRTYQHGGTGTTYRVHIFYTAGSFVLTTYATYTMDIMIVGGGGGGGNGLGGGGGGGCIVFRTGFSVIGGSYAVVVGAGGAAQTSGDAGGHYGIPSSITLPSIGTVTALGGGGGGGEPNNDPQGSTANWGNSGGGSYNEASRFGVATHPTYSGWTVRSGGQGATGGGGGAAHPSGGGGSSEHAATNPANNQTSGPGAEGDNRTTWVTPRLYGQSGTHNGVAIDDPYYFTGGGGGGKHTSTHGAGNGGLGGGGGGANGNTSTGGGDRGQGGPFLGANGGAGGNAAGGVGANGTGGGGGGGCDGTGHGAAGGTGTVIVRYPITV